MSEPRRLLDDASSEMERALLREGARYRCSDYRREKVLAGLGLMGAAGFGSAAATFSLRHILDAGPVPWIAGFSVVGLAATVPLSLLLNRPVSADFAVPRVMTALTEMHVPRLPVGPRVGDTGSDAVLAGSERGDARVVEQGSVSRFRSAQKARIQPKAASLTAELKALDEARSLLGSGQPSAALTCLDAYARDYPAGRLELESEVLRIDALAQSGRGSAAKQRAEAFLRLHPKSVLASRVRRHVSD